MGKAAHKDETWHKMIYDMLFQTGISHAVVISNLVC